MSEQKPENPASVPTSPWTQEVPTEEGWYWTWRAEFGFGDLDVVHLMVRRGRLSYAEEAFEHLRPVELGNWWLRIPKPSAPHAQPPPAPADDTPAPNALREGSWAESEAFFFMESFGRHRNEVHKEDCIVAVPMTDAAQDDLAARFERARQLGFLECQMGRRVDAGGSI